MTDQARGGFDFDFVSTIELIARTFPDRPAVIHETRCETFSDFIGRAHRLARFLSDRGFGCFTERSELAGHEVGQHLMAQYLHNSPEYLEGMIGAYGARVAPFNVNYRYGVEELGYILRDARPAIIQFHSTFAPLLREALGSELSGVLLLQVADDSDEPLLPGAIDYEQALAAAEPALVVTPRADDLYVLYTGGTTGMPKGVLWRQADIAVSACGLQDRRNRREWASVEEFTASLAPIAGRVMPCAPLMHGAAQWGALQALTSGSTVVLPGVTTHFDPTDVVDTVVLHGVTQLGIVGDAFAVPLLAELERRPRVLPSLRHIVSGGAALQPTHKERLLAAMPGMRIVETIGASESGIQGRSEVRDVAGAEARGFRRAAGTVVVAEDRSSLLRAGHPGIGWLASRGRVPLGYLGDAEKTRESFPVIAGERLSLPGDRARLLDSDVVQLLGRDGATVNSGGEKIFAEEVEAAVKAHPAVADAVVCGRPSMRWGSEVVGIVALRPGALVTERELRNWCGSRIASFKVPKAIVFVAAVQRTAIGKADYRWAAEHATATSVG
ncbi:AMP-binding protein [Nocardia vinacea]|uniref:AMP-binding protein n=1 Tax=Nocardia vinacea TaxID=96468 RepID=A0ABZ1YTM2_9NOCA|nr:AMP-binding protein [Nocardia vinacea]